MKALFELRRAGLHARRQDLGFPRHRSPARLAGREPGDDRRVRCVIWSELGREVIYDAEHFFDGWKANPDYAAQTIRAAAEAGAKLVVLCDTNGGTHAGGDRGLTRQAARPSRSTACRSASTATTTANWPWPTRWRRSTPAPSRCRARSTVLASGAATPT